MSGDGSGSPFLRRWDVLLSGACLLLLLLGLAFAWGVSVMRYQVFPHSHVRKVLAAAEALQTKRKFVEASRDKDRPMHERLAELWYETGEERSGVVVHVPEACYGGLTFFCDSTASAFLVDMNGTVVHRWHKPFSEVWPDPTHIIDRVPEEQIYWRNARLLPNGDVLAIYEGMNQSPYGGGLVKLDRDSNLLWKLSLNAHHDLDVAADGRIFVLTQRYENPGTRINDYVTVVSPAGAVLEEIPLLRAFQESLYATLVRRNPGGDYLHTNNVEILTEQMAREYPWFSPGDLLLSHAKLSAATVLDGRTHVVKFAIAGLADMIHDADFAGKGRIVFFDNDGSRTFPGTKASRIMAYDIAAARPELLYEKRDFYSTNRGSQQLLPNGNILITESTAGRILEVTPAGRIVWKYVSANRDDRSVGVVDEAVRYAPGSLDFVGREGAGGPAREGRNTGSGGLGRK